MSEPGSPEAMMPRVALRALFQQVNIEIHGGDREPTQIWDDAISEFLATWVVCKPSDLIEERAAQAGWQEDAKVAFAVLITALNNIGNRYPALKLGPLVLAEAERMIHEKGMDPEEVLERFLP